MADRAATASPVRVDGGGFEVDAVYLARHFGLDPAEVPGLLRDRRLQARCERGEGEDAGRHRLSFRLGASRLTLIVDDTGKILRRSAISWPESAQLR